MFLNLLAKIGLNTVGLETGLKRSQRMVDKTGEHISREFRKKFMRAFGAGAVIAGMSTLTKRTFDYGQQLIDLSRKHGITTDEVQQIDAAARAAMMTFDEYAEAVKNGGESLAEFAKRAQLSREEIRLTAAQIKDIAELNATLAGAGVASKSFMGRMISGAKEFGRLFTESDVAKMNRRAGEVKPPGQMHGPEIPPDFVFAHMRKDEKEEAFKRFTFPVDRPNVNALQSMGAYSASNQGLTEQKKSNQLLQEIRNNTRKLPQGDGGFA